MTERFRYLMLMDEPKAALPDGYSAPIDTRTTRELIAERLQNLQTNESKPLDPEFAAVWNAYLAKLYEK